MRKLIILFSGLLVLVAGSAFADKSIERVSCNAVSTEGKRARKNVRHLLLLGNLKADKKLVYEEYGYTPHRLRFDYAGRKTERSRYYAEGLEFTFDDQGNIVEERTIQKEDRRVN